MQPNVQSAKARIARAKTHLTLDEPFFGNLLYRLKFVEDFSADTAWVDGVQLGYNPNYVATISDEELKGLLCHEVLHVACGHCWRRLWRDAEKWNKAADYAINLIVLEAGYNLPPNGLVDKEYKGKAAEVIYDLLPTPAPQSSPPKGSKADSSQSNSSENDDNAEKKSSENGQKAEAGEQETKDSKDSGKDKAAGKGTRADSSKKSDTSSQDPGADGDSSGPSSPETDEPKREGADPQQSKGRKGTKKSQKDAQGANGEDSKGKQKGQSSEPSSGEAARPMDTSDKPFGQKVAGEVRDAPADVNQSELEAEWKIAVQEALACATRRGNAPGGLKATVAEAL